MKNNRLVYRVSNLVGKASTLPSGHPKMRQNTPQNYHSLTAPQHTPFHCDNQSELPSATRGGECPGGAAGSAHCWRWF